MNGAYKTLVSNSLWTLIGNMGSRVLAFVLLPFYTKWLGTDGFGQSDLITTYSNLLIGFITLCVSEAILIFVKGKERQEQSAYFSVVFNFILLLFFIWGVVFVLINYFCSNANITNVFVDNIGVIFTLIPQHFDLTLFISS